MATPAQWVAGARPRTLPAAARARARRHRRRRRARRLPAGAGAARAGRRARAAGGGQLRQRLLRRHAAAPTPTGSGPMRLVGSGAATPRQVLVAAGLAFAVAARRRPRPRGAVELVAGRGGRGLHRRRLDLHRRPAALRLPGAGRGLRLRVLRPGRRRRDDVRADRHAARAWRSPSSVPIGLLIVAILVVNNLRDIDGDAARRQADPGGAARRPGRPACCSSACSSSPSPSSPPWACRGRGRCSGCSPPRWRSRRRAPCSAGGRGPALIGALQGTGLLTLATGVLLGAGLALSG